MAKWKTADELYQWAKNEQLKALEWCEKHYLDEVSKDNKQTICSKPHRMFRMSEAYLENIKILDNETVSYLAGTFDTHENIDLLNISRFAGVYENIKFFKASKVSRDGTKYKQKIASLKKNADEQFQTSKEVLMK